MISYVRPLSERTTGITYAHVVCERQPEGERGLGPLNSKDREMRLEKDGRNGWL